MKTEDEIKQTSIQMDTEWRKMIDDLADRWGFRKGKHVTYILRSCTARMWQNEFGNRPNWTAQNEDTT